MLANTDPRATLHAVADLLAHCGSVQIRGDMLFLDGTQVAFINASRALVLSAQIGADLNLVPAQNVKRGTPAHEIAADIVARIQRRAA